MTALSNPATDEGGRSRPRRHPLAADPILADLANRANTEHHAYEATQSAAIAHAIACGTALLEAKAMLPHGEWLPWLADNVDFGERTAQHYMRIARNPQRVSDLPSLRQAIADLAEPRLKPNWRKLEAVIADRPSVECLDNLWRLHLHADPEWRARRAGALIGDGSGLIGEGLEEMEYLAGRGYRIDGYTIDKQALAEQLRAVADRMDPRTDDDR
jgi:Protein of unknown function (DUF3102)